MSRSEATLATICTFDLPNCLTKCQIFKDFIIKYEDLEFQ